MGNQIILYNPKLKQLARYLRKHGTLSEILLWKKIQNNAFGIEFHRQVPIHEFIVDFYCHELKLAIEIDGNSHDFKYEYDSARQNILEDFGIILLRFTDSEVKQKMSDVIRVLEDKIAELQNKTSPNPLQRGN